MATVLPAFNPVAGVAEAIGPLAQFIGQRRQQTQLRQKQLQDSQLLNQIILQQQQGGQLGVPGLGGLGNFQTPGGAGAFSNFLAQQPTQFQQQLDQAKLGLIKAQTGAAGRIDPVKGVSQSPGSQVVNPVTGDIISEATPFKPTEPKQSESVIIDPKDSSRAIRVRNIFDPKSGKLTDQIFIGEATKAESIGGVSPELFNNLQKPVATKIQKDLTDAQLDVSNLESIRDSFEDRFAELPFRIAQGVTAIREKAGGFLGKPTGEQKKDLVLFSKWRRGASREFVVFKKWATGVAAGQKEMSEQIETAFASPNKDSATQFKAKIDDSIAVRKRTIQILEGILNSGQITTVGGKRQAEQNALRQALAEHETGQITQQPPAQQGTGTAQQPQFSSDEIEAELKRRGL